MKALFGLVLILISSVAMAQSRVGNGGGGVLCDEEIQLLDFYEAPQFDFTIENLGQGAKVEDYVGSWLQNLSRLNPSRARLYSYYLSTFWNDTRWVGKEDSLGEILDQGVLSLPKKCQYVQIAGQQDPTFGKKRYLIVKEYFERLSVQHQAGLVLHEMIWRDMRSQKNWIHKQSGSIRFLTALIASEQLKTMSYDDFVKRMIAASVETVDAPDWSPMTTHDCTMQKENPHEQNMETIHLYDWNRKDLYLVRALPFCSQSDSVNIGSNPKDKNQGDWIQRRMGPFYDLLLAQLAPPQEYLMDKNGVVHSMKWGGSPGIGYTRQWIDLGWAVFEFRFTQGFSGIRALIKENKIQIDDLMGVTVKVFAPGPQKKVIQTHQCDTVEIDLNKKTHQCVELRKSSGK